MTPKARCVCTELKARLKSLKMKYFNTEEKQILGSMNLNMHTCTESM